MADNNTIARPYARAAFELAHTAGELDRWSRALAVAALLLEDGQVVKLLHNPALGTERRRQVLSDLFSGGGEETRLLAGGDQRGTNFIKLLLEYGRVSVLPEISKHFEALKAQVENSVEVTVTSATALSEARMSEIAAALKARLGRDVRVASQIDENLIGGAVIRAGDVVIDGSVRSRLEGLTNVLVT